MPEAHTDIARQPETGRDCCYSEAGTHEERSRKALSILLGVSQLSVRFFPFSETTPEWIDSARVVETNLAEMIERLNAARSPVEGKATFVERRLPHFS
jgi:hypothetical protein